MSYNNDESSWNIESTSSSTIKTKKIITNSNQYHSGSNVLLNKSTELKIQLEYCKTPSTAVSKRQFIEQWLLAHRKVVQGESQLNSVSSVIANSPPTKRPLRSPLKDFNQVKRFKKKEEIIKPLCQLEQTFQTKKYKLQENNIENNCRAAIFSSRKNCRKTNSPVNELINKPDSCELVNKSTKSLTEFSQYDIYEVASQSPQAFDIESLASSGKIESPPSIDFESPIKSGIETTAIEQIESASSNAEEEIQFVDSDNDVASSEVIEDADTNSINNKDAAENFSPIILIQAALSTENSDDSDETFYSPESPLNKTLIPDVSSQVISEISDQSLEKHVEQNESTDYISLDISTGTSLPAKQSQLENYQPLMNVNNTVKKKKKPKKFVILCL